MNMPKRFDCQRCKAPGLAAGKSGGFAADETIAVKIKMAAAQKADEIEQTNPFRMR